MRLIDHIRRLALFVRFEFGATFSYLIAFIIHIVVIPVTIAVLTYLLLGLTGFAKASSIAIYMFLITVLASVIPLDAQLVASKIMPDMKDFLKTVYGDIRIVIPGTVLTTVPYIIPMLAIAIILLKNLWIIIPTIVAYLFTSSLGTLIGVLTREPFKAMTVSNLVYLSLIMGAPVYLYTNNMVLRLVSLAVLTYYNPLYVLYVLALAITLLTISTRKVQT